MRSSPKIKFPTSLTEKPRQPRRQGPEDPSIRRTWWLLAGAFLILGAITLLRLFSSRALVDVIPVVVVATVVMRGSRGRRA